MSAGQPLAVRASVTTYRFLLRLLPAWFGRRFAAEAVEVFHDLAADMHSRSGVAGLARLWSRTLVDVMRGVWQERQTYSSLAGVAPTLRGAARSLRSEPGFAAAVVATIGLGVGCTAAIYTLAHGILLRPLPFPESERVLSLCEVSSETTGYCVASPPNVRDLGSMSASIDHAGSARTWRFRHQQGNESAPVVVGIATRGFLDAYSVRLLHGRLFTDAELAAGDNRVVVLTHGLWQEWSGGEASFVGTTVNLDGVEFSVIGVLTADSWVPEFDHARGWAPLTASPDNPDQRDWRGFVSVARVAEDASIEEARAELSAAYTALASEYPDDLGGWSLEVQRLRGQLTGSAVPVLRLFGLAVSCLLLIGCANVANLLIVRAQGKASEVAVRAALGAGRLRLGSQLLAESLMLALAGGLVGLGLAYALVRLGIRLAPPGIPRINEVVVDLDVALFALALALLTAAVFGLMPAMRVARTDVASALRGSRFGDADAARVRRGILVLELGLAMTLLAGAGLGIKGFVQLTSWDPGFEQDGLVVTWMVADFSQLKSGVEIAERFDEAEVLVESLPGIEAVGQASSLPLYGGIETGELRVDGTQPGGQLHMVQHFDIAPGYFDALGVPVLRGRDIAPSDDANGAPVAVINETLAQRYWPETDPLGAEVTVGDHPATVVGIVRDMLPFTPTEPVRPAVYWPRRQYTRGATYLVMRTTLEPAAVERIVRDRLAAELPVVEVTSFTTLRQRAGNELVSPRFQMMLLAAFATGALLLSSVGVYSIVSYGVAQRRQEIGVRMALGARPGRISAGFVAAGVRLAFLGGAVGIVAALAFGRSLESMLYGVSSTDPAALLVVAGVFVAIAALASWLPARRAARVDPMSALRAD